MREVPIQHSLKTEDDPVTVLPAKSVKIHKIMSVEAFKRSGIDFSKLKKGMIFDGKIVVANKN